MATTPTRMQPSLDGKVDGRHTPTEAPSGAAVGWISFAGFMMILGGSFAILAGLGLLIHPDTYPLKDSVFQASATTWGWWKLIIGTIVLLSGFGVFTGNMLARTVGVIAATLSAIGAFVFMPLYPLWAICLIAIDVSVIWAVTAHGRDIQKLDDTVYVE
jgi:multisubunit Na+/H+ antiporter MnhG subunit